MLGMDIKTRGYSYAERTNYLVNLSNVVLYFYTHKSPGYRCTAKAAHQKLVPVCLDELDVSTVVRSVVRHPLANGLFSPDLVLNVAGHGLANLPHYTQDQCDSLVYTVLSGILSARPIHLVTSGGQTGFDESGAVVAHHLGIDVLAVLPDGYRYRDSAGIDHTATLGETRGRLTRAPSIFGFGEIG